MKLTTKLEFEHATIEVTEENNDIRLWVFNKVTQDHAGVTLKPGEFSALSEAIRRIRNY